MKDCFHYTRSVTVMQNYDNLWIIKQTTPTLIDFLFLETTPE